MSAQCAVCGAPAPPPFRPPRPEQAPDLDGRPGEPARSTLRRWVARCRSCGACGPDLTRLPNVAAKTVDCEAYRAIPSAFLRAAAICRAAGDAAGAAEATLQAAWEADDAGRDARALRLGAIADWGEANWGEANWGEVGSPDQALRLLDVLRRAEAFERAQARAEALATRPLDEVGVRLLAFQRERIAARDAGRYLISSALRPPARTPHVTHGQPAAASFWRRLTGR